MPDHHEPAGHSPRQRLDHALHDAAHLLPDQGPIGVFVHHNTLHALQHLPFHEAVVQAASIYGAEPYLREAAFRRHLEAGRIQDRDLRDALGWNSAGLEAARRNELWRDLKQGPPRRRRALPARNATRPRDALLERGGSDVDELIRPLLIRWCAAYLDEGVAYWPMPARRAGLFRATLRQWALVAPGVSPWERELGADAADVERAGTSPDDMLLAILDELGLEGDAIEAWVRATLLSLRGWAGMMSRLERHPEDRAPGAPPASLLEFLALQAMALRRAEQWVAREELGLEGVEDAWEPGPPGAAGSPEREAELFRRRVMQEAYEWRYARQILDGLHHRRPQAFKPRSSRYQIIFCFDEREESIRRHLEERHPEFETLGAPGFFGVAMNYKGLDDAGFAPLCPVVVKPTHRVEEHTVEADAEADRRRLRARWARVDHAASFGARSLVRGAVLSMFGGVFAAFPVLSQTLAPRALSRFIERSRSVVMPDAPTELTVFRDESRGDSLGFSPAELAERVGNILENIGLVDRFGPIVAVMGHGSTTQNNPHASAYNCGACGGREGNASARLFATAANDPGVRALLAARGIVIPEATWFVGALHDTCSDAVTYFDTDRIPRGLRQSFDELKEAIDDARMHGARERCRRFEAAPSKIGPRQALAHVEDRAARIDEPRPEFGHATNAVAIVGRRALTRGLFLDRRAFLISYDPTIDGEGKVLERILAAATPVGAGINLEYYFSCVDNEVYGCGTKLPHNLTGLLGVMNGHASDLRTGLPLQTVEIHEPMRLLVIVEATTERLLEIAGRQAEVRELVENEWVRLVSLDPETGDMKVFRGGSFVPYTPDEIPPTRTTSRGWYRGRREHLPPALIEPAPGGER